MKTACLQRLIWPTERIPIDFRFDLDSGDSISTYQRVVYDISDNAKTDLSGTVVDIGGVVHSGIDQDTVRLAVHNLTLGHEYHFAVEAETSLGRTHSKVLIVRCGYDSVNMPVFPYGAAKRYTLHYDDDLPSAVSLTDSDVDCTAFESADLASDIWDGIATQLLVSEQKATVDLENLQKGGVYILNVLLTTSTDSVTDTTYLIGQRMVIPCREL